MVVIRADDEVVPVVSAMSEEHRCEYEVEHAECENVQQATPVACTVNHVALVGSHVVGCLRSFCVNCH